jgi:diguanylate cyclase (GGDEF)-like protein
MGAPARRPPAAAVAAVLVVTALMIGALFLPESLGWDRTLVGNLVALVMSTVAAVCAFWRAANSAGRHRRAWTALGAGIASWVVGESIWTWLQANGVEPFPSVADLAFLCFGPLICLGLLVYPVGGERVQRLQSVLDAVAVTSALVLVSWVSALGAAVRSAEQELPLAAAASITYAALDLVVSVLAVLALARAPAGARTPLALLVVGLVLISVADSAFVYLVATTGYVPGTALDVTWDLGFGCLAMAALLDRGHEARRSRRTTRDEIVASGGLLPYLPVGIALAVVILTEIAGREPSPTAKVAALVLVGLLLARQYLTLRQNAVLVARVAAREEELEYRALHDGLTGLANRVLFRERLEHALDLHARDRRPVAVVYLDLDDFKQVNDTLGHAAGDELLVRVTERINGAVRTGDTVARLGGDEFAVLLETGDDPQRCADRIADALRDPFHVVGRPVRAGASTGTVHLGPGDPAVPADELMARADRDMYTRKRTRGRRPTRVESG